MLFRSYIERTRAVMEGTWKSHDVWYGLKEGMVQMAPYGDAVPQEVRDAADAVKNAIIDGSLHPFQGPIRNQAGEVVVAEGEVVSDKDLLGMNWYVEGVQGELPQ